MGCKLPKRIIPREEPGILLKKTGVPEFDSQYHRCEESLTVIKHAREKLEEAQGDFIRILGAEKHYAEKKSVPDLMKMMLVCLSVQGKGDLDSIGLTYEEESPFIDCQM